MTLPIKSIAAKANSEGNGTETKKVVYMFH